MLLHQLRDWKIFMFTVFILLFCGPTRLTSPTFPSIWQTSGQNHFNLPIRRFFFIILICCWADWAAQLEGSALLWSYEHTAGGDFLRHNKRSTGWFYFGGGTNRKSGTFNLNSKPSQRNLKNQCSGGNVFNNQLWLIIHIYQSWKHFFFYWYHFETLK